MLKGFIVIFTCKTIYIFSLEKKKYKTYILISFIECGYIQEEISALSFFGNITNFHR
jgi:hypothetical protein